MTQQPSTVDPAKIAEGVSIPCIRCSGYGLTTVWSFGVKEPEECRDCFGSGRNWQYPGGAIAKHYAGPLIGRNHLQETNQ